MAVAGGVAPARRSGIETAIAFQLGDQLGSGIGRYPADRRSGVQGPREIDCRR